MTDRCKKPKQHRPDVPPGHDHPKSPVTISGIRNWPQRVLAMNLRRVGSGLGPDHELTMHLATRIPGCQVYAAGGVRSIEDLLQVQATGAAGALLASALHEGRIGRAQLATFT